MDVSKKHSAQRDDAGRKGPNYTSSRSANLPWPLMVGAFAVDKKAVQDFTETARQVAMLNQHFRHASFAEFEMLIGLDDVVLKRYGLPTPMVDRALLEAYQTVVLDQQRYRDHP